MVRSRSAKPLFPGSNPGGASKTVKSSLNADISVDGLLFLLYSFKVKKATSYYASNHILDTYEIHTSSVSGITLTPKLEGVTDKYIEYQWTIDSDTESGLNKLVIYLLLD